MTGSTQVLMSLGSGRALGPVASLQNNSTGTGIRGATATLNNDGTGSASRSPTGGTGTATCSDWYAPAPTTGIGSSFWCKLTITTQTNTSITGSSTGVVLALSGTTSWTFSSSATNAEGTGSGVITIYADSGGTILVATGSVAWDVGFTP